MRKVTTVRTLAALTAAVLSVSVGVVASQARDATPTDVERVTHTPAARALAAAPAKIDSDIYASTVSPTGRNYFVVSGHLRLSLTKGSTTVYAGTLVDYTGNVVYKAAANTENPSVPRLAFTSKNGAFRFKSDSNFGSPFYSGTGLSVPKTLHKPAKEVTLVASAHKATAATYSFTLSQRVGPVQALAEYAGSITFVYDANFRISGGQVTVEDAKGRQVTNPLRSTGYFSPGSYFYTAGRIDKQLFGLNGTFSGTSLSGYGFTGDGLAASQWVMSGSAA